MGKHRKEVFLGKLSPEKVFEAVAVFEALAKQRGYHLNIASERGSLFQVRWGVKFPVFFRSQKCALCGLVGTHFLLVRLPEHRFCQAALTFFQTKP